MSSDDIVTLIDRLRGLLVPTADPPLLLDVKGVAALMSCSVRDIRRMIDAGEFPRPIAIGEKLKRWPRSLVLAWIAQVTERTK